MNTNIVINNISVELDVVGGVLFATSLQIAQVFEREHKSVIRSIENLPNDEFRRLNFVPSNQIRQNGLFDKETKFYKITRDGFSLLVMGFTGEKAYKWKIEFINAFNKMEAMIKTNKININAKFDEILSELSHKVALVNEFKQKYFE
ncbi:Rha family transcriptional regulator, partial [Campylobacter fetus]